MSQDTINKVIEIVESEEELDGEMPDEIFETISYMVYNKDKENLAEMIRVLVRQTKNSIIENIKKEFKDKYVN